MQITEGYSISVYIKHGNTSIVCCNLLGSKNSSSIKVGRSSYYNHTLIMFKFGEVLVEATAAILLGLITPGWRGSKQGCSTESVMQIQLYV